MQAIDGERKIEKADVDEMGPRHYLIDRCRAGLRLDDEGPWRIPGRRILMRHVNSRAAPEVLTTLENDLQCYWSLRLDGRSPAGAREQDNGQSVDSHVTPPFDFRRPSGGCQSGRPAAHLNTSVATRTACAVSGVAPFAISNASFASARPCSPRARTGLATPAPPGPRHGRVGVRPRWRAFASGEPDSGGQSRRRPRIRIAVNDARVEHSVAC